ncbi:hypothetical protein BJX68DRAFT_264096 [Aspergillus pseudodeflectus]|uniref:Uncharacterized protein n=1 Tax=Aspergillus pseudodeflectus TaxID=176178 RepID=A0ABR4KWU3_9EURO
MWRPRQQHTSELPVKTDHVASDIKDMMLKQTELALRKEIDQVDSRVRELEEDQKQLSNAEIAAKDRK